MQKTKFSNLWLQTLWDLERSMVIRMQQTVYAETMGGLMAERVIRREEYSMQSRHIHGTYEAYFLLEGERYFFIGRETYRIHAGTVVLIKREQIHKTSMADKAYHDRILLQIEGEWMDSYLKAHGMPEMEECFSYLGGALVPSDKEWDRLLEMLNRLREEMEGKQKWCELLIRQKMAEILVVLYRSKQQADMEIIRTQLKAEGWKYRKVSEIAAYLTEHCETGESLEEIAKRFYISKSYLTRIFREITGLTVREYVNAGRVRRAKNYLKNSKRSITEIADLTGFDSITYFERVFKRYADVSPLKYRNGERE